MAINVKFTEEDWARVTGAWTAFLNRELDRPLVVIETANMMISTMARMTEEFMLRAPAEELIDYFQEKLEAIEYRGDAWPKWFPNFGPGALAGFLGANVTFRPQQNTVWYETENVLPIDRLDFNLDPENFLWRRVLEVTRAAVDRFGSSVSVGHTDLGGNLDVLASFRGANRLLLELIDEPEEVLRLSRRLTQIWRDCYDQLTSIIQPAGRGTSGWAEIWAPRGTTYMTQSDFSFMISPKMFERFVMPNLEDCCRRLDHAFYHLDGKGEIPHLDLLLSLDKLAGIQWIPGAGQPQPEEWMPLLKRIVDGGKLCQVYVTAAGARRIVREIGGRGFVLYVVPFPVMSKQEAADFLKTLAEEDVTRGRHR